LTPTLEQRTQAELEWRAPLQKLRATLPCAFLAGEPAITVGRRWLVVEAETDNQKAVLASLTDYRSSLASAPDRSAR